MKTKAKPKTKTKWIEYGGRFDLAGVQYSDYELVKKKLKRGKQVRFIGEPSNLYDNKAIRVELDGVRIGYIPRASAIQHGLWSEHGAKSVIIGVITAVSWTNPTWHMITVQVLVKRKHKQLTKTEGEVHFSKLRDDLSYQNR